MQKHFTTHLTVLMQTFPELRLHLEALVPNEFSEKNLMHLMDSPIYGIHIKNMINIVNSHSMAFNKVNLIIQHVNKLVDDVSLINFEHLSDPQRERLPEFAKEIDGLNDKMGMAIIPMVDQDRGNVIQEVDVRTKKSIQSIKELESNLDLLVEHVNKEYDVDVKWTEGKSILTWEELDEWQSRLKHVNQKHLAKINKNREGLIDFLRAVVLTEVLSNLYTSTSMTEKKVVDDKIVKKIIKYLGKVDLDRFLFEECNYDSSQVMQTVNQCYDKMQDLEVEMNEYPKKSDDVSEEAMKDLDRLVSTKKLFTQVGGSKMINGREDG